MAAMQPLLHLQGQVIDSVRRIQEAAKVIAQSGTDHEEVVQLKVFSKNLKLLYNQYEELYRECITACDEEEEFEAHDEAYVAFECLLNETCVLVESQLVIATSGVAENQQPAPDATLQQTADELDQTELPSPSPVLVSVKVLCTVEDAIHATYREFGKPHPASESSLETLQLEEQPCEREATVLKLETVPVKVKSETDRRRDPVVVVVTSCEFLEPSAVMPSEDCETDSSRLDPDPPTSEVSPVPKPAEPPPIDKPSDPSNETNPRCVCRALVTANPASKFHPTEVRQLDAFCSDCSACLSHPYPTNKSECCNQYYPPEPSKRALKVDPDKSHDLSPQSQTRDVRLMFYATMSQVRDLCFPNDPYALGRRLDRPVAIHSPNTENMCLTLIQVLTLFWCLWTARVSGRPSCLREVNNEFILQASTVNVSNELCFPDVVPPADIDLHSCFHPPISF